MQITEAEVKTILKQLPISYYLKSNIPIILNNNIKQSYFNQKTYEIHIALNQILQLDIDGDKEELIRGMLYHELSHVILTPQLELIIIDKDIFNIFEDERIETALKDYYMNVDFKHTLSIVSPMSDYPENNIELFFNLVRHRRGDKDLVELVDKIINRHKIIKDLKAYQNDIMSLFYLMCKRNEAFTKDLEIPQLELSSKKMINEYGKPSNNDEEEELSEAISQVIARFKPGHSDIFNLLKCIIASKRVSNGNNSESRPSYSGKLLPKRIAKPSSDYKWFTKQGDGFLRNGKKLILNLFIDSSGSFKRNEETINTILRDLVEIEKSVSNFKFNLVSINYDCVLHKPNERYITCEGTNCLTSLIKLQFGKLQMPEAKVMNLVLFDGNAICSKTIDPITQEVLEAYSFKQAEHFKAFNKANTIIISDTSNQSYINEYCYATKRIYSKHYVEELKNNIVKSFKILFQ